MLRKLALAILLIPAVCSTALPATIVVGNHLLIPNTPGQIIDVFVTGGGGVAGLNFNAQIADGGPQVGGVIVGPSIKGHILPAGAPATTYNPLLTIFQPNNTGEQDVSGGLSQFLGLITTTSSGTVNANGLLARLSIDTTGFMVGSWPLLLHSTINGDTDFSGVPINIENGSISIIPEPASVVMGMLALAGFAVVAIRKRYAK